MPMIIAVAVSIGIRRVLSHENIYTIKLVCRRHFIPKALHASMFLVHQARDVMDRDILLVNENGRDRRLLSPVELRTRQEATKIVER
jgi:chloride channel protein, CIC family